MTQHITQEQVVDMIASMPVLKATPSASEIATLTCNAAIQHYLSEQAKELPVLPDPYEVIDLAANSHMVYTADKLKAYGAACAAHAREVALSEASDTVNDLSHDASRGDCMIAIEQLKAGK